MATRAEFESAIDALLSHPLGVNRYPRGKQYGGKVYEAYVFSLCVKAARELGANVELRGIQSSAKPFLFRGAPGRIYSKFNNFGYAKFQLNGKKFEIHCSIEYEGRSGMSHELDVSILRSIDAQRCREGLTSPKAASLVVALECKYYGGSLPKESARTFVGLIDDMGRNFRLSGLCSNSWNRDIGLYFSPKRRPYSHFGLGPLNTNAETRFLEQAKIELEKLAPSP